MNPFKYHRAENLQRAKDQQNLDENAKYLGGGMTLLPAMKHGGPTRSTTRPARTSHPPPAQQALP
jgi:CO/xanthine dehydrogenase FAD-binding subunit